VALLVRMTQARRILEIGTLGAYSAIWMARALPAERLLFSRTCLSTSSSGISEEIM
jgi:predicted O-methyltransferase YrrM